MFKHLAGSSIPLVWQICYTRIIHWTNQNYFLPSSPSASNFNLLNNSTYYTVASSVKKNEGKLLEKLGEMI